MSLLVHLVPAGSTRSAWRQSRLITSLTSRPPRAWRRRSSISSGRPAPSISSRTASRARPGPEERQPAGGDDLRRSGETARVRRGCVLGGRARGAARRYVHELPGDLAFGPSCTFRTAKADSVPVGDPARALVRASWRSKSTTNTRRTKTVWARVGARVLPRCELGVRARDPCSELSRIRPSHRTSSSFGGLAKRMETAAVLPLEEDEAADAVLARRLLYYRALVHEIAGRLEKGGLATDVKYRQPSLPDAARRELRHAPARQVRSAVRHRAQRLARFLDHAAVGVLTGSTATGCTYPSG